MFGKKAKQIVELENKNRILKESNDYRQEKIIKLEKALDGEHCITKYCLKCDYGIACGFDVVCELECRCKDYIRK